MDPLAEQVVVVTGGVQGIGRAVAEIALAQGARVGVLDLPRPELETAGAELGEGACVVAADVADAQQVSDGIAAITAALGSPTVLINNAGRNSYADPVTMTEDEWDAFFTLDLKAAWLCARAVLPSMISRRHGSIVNIASIHATLTSSKFFPYAAAKSGLVGLTRSLALEVAEHQVRVNAVSPGYTRTPQIEEWLASEEPTTERDVVAVHPLGRIGTPAEIAQVVCFLACDAASFVTGANWAVDGGLSVRFA